MVFGSRILFQAGPTCVIIPNYSYPTLSAEKVSKPEVLHSTFTKQLKKVLKSEIHISFASCRKLPTTPVVIVLPTWPANAVRALSTCLAKDVVTGRVSEG